MERKEFKTIDKANWPRGEWDNEPDKVQWQDNVTGLPCLIVRGPTGALCGYVGVPEGHPYFRRDYDDVPADVHGGLSFADHCQDVESERHGICHTPDKGEPDNVWWLGFDCAHAWDVMPGNSFYRAWGTNDIYRDLAYVEREVSSLARQLANAGTTETGGSP